MKDMCVTQFALHIDNAVETYSSVKVVTTLERAFNLDTCITCLFLRDDIERFIECRKVQFATVSSSCFGKR